MGKNVKFFGITRTNILRIISLTVILAFIMPGITNAQSGKANFAGNWTYNASKSTPPPTGGGGGGGGGGGRGGMGAGANFVATMNATTLTTTTARTGQDGTVSNRVVAYTLDGKENTMAPPAGGGGGGGGTPGKYVATWSADGKTLTIVTTRTTQNGERKSSEAWTLTDANTLTRTTTSNNNGTENKRVAVYEKK
jgi:hypothetical protein